MGRLEDALRRAGARRKGIREESPDEPATPFVSPWKFEVLPVSQATDERERTGPEKVHAGTPSIRGPLRPEAGVAGQARLQIESQLATGWPQPFGAELAGKLVAQPGIDRGAVEQYAAIAQALVHRQAERAVKTVFVAGAAAGDGATLTAINLAFTLSRMEGRRVLLVDAHFNSPRVHRLFQVSLRPGLRDWLNSDPAAKPPAITLTERLALTPAGTTHPEPGLLGSDRMRQALAAAAQSFDWIVVDGPPASGESEAGALASLMDTVILVVHSGKTLRTAAAQAVETLGRDRVLGVVFNRATSGR